ncbi:MAG: OmpA family protein [Okeania sp. SIO2C9]|uniref:OmpA family protein n=1 Tax=Okeania sp. SIO2C9 TaxID=2607791 RepID=UPI0013C092E6|nr:OmpA family protein [Okeania sp. SIO2C9]NEQ71925.1 OmpA family protein [Okeania sp. SIO2C9]
MTTEKKIDKQQTVHPTILAGCMGFMMICAWAFAAPKAFEKPIIEVQLPETEDVDDQTEVTQVQTTETETTDTTTTEAESFTTTTETTEAETTTTAESPTPITTDTTTTQTESFTTTTETTDTETTTQAESPTPITTDTTTTQTESFTTTTETTDTETTTSSVSTSPSATVSPTTNITATSGVETTQPTATSSPEIETSAATTNTSTTSKPQGKNLSQNKTLGQVKFGFDEFELSPQAEQTINSLISEIKEYDPNKVTIRVEGHTSQVGGAQLNQEISQDRANAVVEYLKQQNLPYQVVGKGMGFSQPLPGTDPAADVNQRTVIILTPAN